MSESTVARVFQKVIVPFVEGCPGTASIRIAGLIGGERTVVLVGIIPVAAGASLSTGAMPARSLRKALQNRAAKGGFRMIDKIHVSENPWQELIHVVQEEQPSLLILETCHIESFGITIWEALRSAPCNVAIACGPMPERIKRVAVSIRGGTNAELALRLGLSIARHQNAAMDTVHVLPRSHPESQDIPFRGIERVLKNLPEVKARELRTDDPAKAILAAAREHDLLIMGASARRTSKSGSLGPIAETVLRKRPRGTLIVKVQQSAVEEVDAALTGRTAISVLVDKWFAENTYHADEFDDLNGLVELKQKQGVTVSVALPSLNEEATVGKVIRAIKGELMDRLPLLDEIILMDSDSTDRTREIAAELGVPVHIHQQTLSNYGARAGKGEALWKSLYLTRGDIILWLDTDIVNIHPRFVYGLLGPLLLRPDLLFVKGYYQRPLKVNGKMQASGGGRVTELTARPLLNLFFPELSGVIQPLSGEYGGRRSALEKLPFSSGYGVEIGLLIDIFEKFGLRALAQVDLRERIHHNQPLESLSKMSFAIIQTVVRRLERRYKRNILEDVNKSMKLIRYDRGNLLLDVQEIAEVERPPMIQLREYRKEFGPRPGRKYRLKA